MSADSAHVTRHDGDRGFWSYALPVVAAAFALSALLGPIVYTHAFLHFADPARFGFWDTLLRTVVIAFFAGTPVLLIAYHQYQILNPARRAAAHAIYPATLLFALFALGAGVLYFFTYFNVIVTEAIGGKGGGDAAALFRLIGDFDLGVVRIGGAGMPLTIMFWALFGAWIYIVQDYVSRLRDDTLSARSITFSCLRIILAVTAAALLYFSEQLTANGLTFIEREVPPVKCEERPNTADCDMPLYQLHILRDGSKLVPGALLDEWLGDSSLDSTLRHEYELARPVAQLVVERENGSVGRFEWFLILFSFAAGLAPRAILNRAMRGIVSLSTIRDTRLDIIQGISRPDAHRLFEEGVLSVQQLAYADSEKLSQITRFSENSIEDWIDQARLRLYLVSDEVVTALGAYGVRGWSDLARIKQMPEDELARVDDELRKLNVSLKALIVQASRTWTS